MFRYPGANFHIKEAFAVNLTIVQVRKRSRKEQMDEKKERKVTSKKSGCDGMNYIVYGV